MTRTPAELKLHRERMKRYRGNSKRIDALKAHQLDPVYQWAMRPLDATQA